MKTSIALFMIVGLMGMAALAQEAADDPVARITAYKLGDSREPLTVVEDLVRASLATPEQRALLAARLAALLGTDATHDCKQFVCGQLVFAGGAAEVPALAALLADPKTADMARYALERIPGPEADNALIEALPPSSGPTRVGIVNSLGNRRCAGAVAPLSELAKNEDVAVAEAAVAAIGRIGTAEACVALEALAPEASPEIVETLNGHLLQCADAKLAAGEKTEAIRIYNALMESPGRARVAAFQGMVEALGDDGANLMLMRLMEGDMESREMAVRVARNLPGDEITGKLAEAASEMDAAGQTMLIGVLAERGGADAHSAVIAATESQDEGVRAAAVAALAKVGTESDVMMLARMAAGTSGQERLAVQNTLYRMRGESVDQEILRNLESGDAAVRVELIRATAERRIAAATPVLLNLAIAPETEVREASFKALADLASPADVEALIGLLAGVQTDADRNAAERAVVTVMKNASDEQTRNAPVVAALNAAMDVKVKASLASVLGTMGDSVALDAIRAAAQDADESVRLAAIGALADWSRPEVADDLAGVLARETVPSIRDRALRGYVRVLALPSAMATSDVLARYEQLLAGAVSVDEKKAVLSGLGKLHGPGTLKIATPYLEDEGLRTEAIAAVLELSRPLCGAFRTDVEAALARIEQLSLDEDVLKQIAAVREMSGRFEDFIVAWEVAGPYQEPGKGLGDLFDTPFAPEDTAATGVVWQMMPTGMSAEKPWLLDLRQFFGGSNSVAYLRTTVTAPADIEAALLLGTDDGVKAWLNGAQVHGVNTSRGVTPDEDHVAVSLRQGENALLLKIINGDADWGACARLRAPDGTPLAGVTCAIKSGTP